MIGINFKRDLNYLGESVDRLSNCVSYMRSISVFHKHQRSIRQKLINKEIELVATKAVDYGVKKRKFIELSQKCEERIATNYPGQLLRIHC